MAPIALGSAAIALRLGGTQITQAYLGATPLIPAQPAGGTPVFQGAGVFGQGSGDIDLVAPAHVANDVALAIFEGRDNDPEPDLSGSGYAPLGSVTNSDSRASVFIKRAATAADLDIVAAPDPGNHWVGAIMTLRGCRTDGPPVSIISTANSGSGDTFSINAGVTTGANRLVIPILAIDADVSGASPQLVSWSNAALTGLTGRVAAQTEIGNGGGVYAATGSLAAAGSTGATTGTLLAATTWIGMHLEAIGP